MELSFMHILIVASRRALRQKLKKCICSGKKVTEYVLKLLNEVVCARIGLDYNAPLEKLSSYNENLGKWVVENQPEHWVLSKFPYPQWDLLTSNNLESTIPCIKLENYHTVLSFITKHREKLAKKLWASKAAISSWIKGVGLTVEQKLMENIARSQEMQVLAYSDQSAKVGTVNGDHFVNLASEECTCAAWQMFGIPCPHAAAVIQYLRGNIYNFVAEWYGRSKQELI
ncbi:hypothetical protein SLEP1_g24311 [Rubroshorea leprosula]|uniref:SWIM-type domain-containing protein n=1 Tax=Rubroshorea leprosula TaxID=152421 RepID=A0AAV5JKI1_9ROSI|nr:hypothetical protein SLEP1_g24311 [Rubroshorea leprosula]